MSLDCEVSDVLAHNGGSLDFDSSVIGNIFLKKEGEALQVYYKSKYIRRIEEMVSVPVMVQRCGLKYKRTWNKFIILCPFHDEKTPSLHFSLTRCVFHCFGCGSGWKYVLVCV